jgi:hypothetical protein
VLNSLAITVHAVAATIAFCAGALALPSGRFLSVYRAALVVMAAALVPALLADWTTTDGVARGVFAGLLALAVVMVVRGELAVRGRPGLTGGPTAGFVDHVGFTLIALADGFAVVTAIRSGLPGWAVGLVAVGIVGIGHVSLVAAKARLVRVDLPVMAA